MSNIVIMNNAYKDEAALYNVMHYCAGHTVDHFKCAAWGGYGVSTAFVDAAIADMNMIKEYWDKTTGKALCHIVVNLYRYTSSKDEKYLAQKLEKERRECGMFAAGVSAFLYSLGYQNCYFQHIDSDIAHVHYVINSVNWADGMKISGTKTLANYIKNYLNTNYNLPAWRETIFRNGDEFFR